MIKKNFFLVILFLILPSITYALGFGDITVFSKLNEPLKVHIELLDSKSMRLDDISVKNASLNSYRRANLPKPEVLNKVRFKARKEADGSIVVELTSKRPVREPFITFIADMKWRKGHLNREYTFLLDPPEFIQKHSRPKADKKKSIKQTSNTRAKTPVFRKSRKVDHNAVIAAHVSGNSYGPTKRADTLWDIAKRVRPDSHVTTYQTMQALFVLNPDAFINGNIDLLKLGKTLTIPTRDEILKINGKPALQNAPKTKKPVISSTKVEVLNQQKVLNKQEALIQQKLPGQVIERPSDKKQLLESKTREITQAQDEARLRIFPPTEELLHKPVSSKKDLLIINKALKTSINTIKLLQSENETLSEQIRQLTDKLNNLDSHNQDLNNKIVEISTLLKDKQVNKAPFQSSSKENQKSNNNNNQVPVTTNKQPQKNAKTALSIDSQLAQPEENSKSFVRKLLTSPFISFALAIFAVFILFALLIVIGKQNNKWKQRKQTILEPNSESIESKPPGYDTSTSYPAQKQSKETTAANPVPQQKSEDKDEDDMDFFEYFEKKINAPDDYQAKNDTPDIKKTGTINLESEVTKPELTEPEVTIDSKDTAEIKFDLDISNEDIQEYEKSISHSNNASKARTFSNNILSEVDTYVAYGSFDKAEKLLQSKMQQSPSDKNLHFKLLECYTLENKRSQFMKHVKEIKNLLNTDNLLRLRVENIYQKTWHETLNIKKFS
ncbi:MAG: FimV/HubP family polar landmark protein [Gammaproteobacteria bacterium]|nr:FimV/HubP family polar landmark protein [Gammaproteobacteria bacterium]